MSWFRQLFRPDVEEHERELRDLQIDAAGSRAKVQRAIAERERLAEAVRATVRAVSREPLR